jgi:hypothetical protein
MSIPSEPALWLAVAWTAMIAMAIVITRWEPRHTHPTPAQCQCIDCVLRRVGR